MAGRFMFTPACCCGAEEALNVCVPGCAFVTEGLFADEDIPGVVTLYRAERYCGGETFWHGFTLDYNASGDLMASPLTDKTKDGGTCACGAVGYYHSLRYAPQAGYISPTAAINWAQSATDTAAEINAYFVWSDQDSSWHYKTGVDEPAWIQVYLLPFDIETYPFSFDVADPSQTSYEAAPPVEIPPGGPHYLTFADCEFTLLPVRTDFATAEAAWSQFHTGTASNYSVSGEDLRDWVNTLTGHIGSQRFYVHRVFMSGGSSLSYPSYPIAKKDTTEGRFYRSGPPGPAMLPEGFTLADYTSTVTKQGQTATLEYTAGTNLGIPLYWKRSAFETANAYAGEYYPIGNGVSYSAPPDGGVFNALLPLGKYSFTPPTVLNPSNPIVYESTAPVSVVPATLVKKDDALSLAEFLRVTETGLLNKLAENRQPTDFFAFWTMPLFHVYVSAPSTPSSLIYNGKVFGHGCLTSSGIYGVTTVEENGTEQVTQFKAFGVATLATARPDRASDPVDLNTANSAGFDASSYNKYYEVRRLSALRTVQYLGATYHLPAIADAVRDAIFPAGSYILTPPESNQTGKTFYFYPMVGVNFGATYL